MTQFLSDDPPKTQDIEDALLDFGFYHTLHDVERMYAEYVNHGNLGYSGGVLEQPPEYWADINTMRLLELYVKHVSVLPKLPQESVFDTLRKTGRFSANWLTHGNDSG